MWCYTTVKEQYVHRLARYNLNYSTATCCLDRIIVVFVLSDHLYDRPEHYMGEVIVQKNEIRFSSTWISIWALLEQIRAAFDSTDCLSVHHTIKSSNYKPLWRLRTARLRQNIPNIDDEEEITAFSDTEKFNRLEEIMFYPSTVFILFEIPLSYLLTSLTNMQKNEVTSVPFWR